MTVFKTMDGKEYSLEDTNGFPNLERFQLRIKRKVEEKMNKTNEENANEYTNI